MKSSNPNAVTTSFSISLTVISGRMICMKIYMIYMNDLYENRLYLRFQVTCKFPIN